MGGGGEAVLREEPKPRAFNRAARPGDGFLARWTDAEGPGVVAREEVAGSSADSCC